MNIDDHWLSIIAYLQKNVYFINLSQRPDQKKFRSERSSLQAKVLTFIILSQSSDSV